MSRAHNIIIGLSLLIGLFAGGLLAVTRYRYYDADTYEEVFDRKRQLLDRSLREEKIEDYNLPAAITFGVITLGVGLIAIGIFSKDKKYV